MDYRLTGMFVWRRVVELNYLPLESLLAVEPMLDEMLLCIDPDGEQTVELAKAIEKKFPEKTRTIYFPWPEKVRGDGSRIGIASQYCYNNVLTSHAVNIQSDEIWCPELVEWTGDNWMRLSDMGYDGFRFKVLNLEHNAQNFQGDSPVSKSPDEKRVSNWSWQIGAGYSMSEKLVKKCPAIYFAHDAWRFEGITMLYHVSASDEYPIMHLHDNFRDGLIELRRNAADQIWTQNPAYGASADGLQNTKEKWYDNPLWTKRTSPFDQWLHPLVKPLIGDTSYHVRWELLNDA